MKHFSPLLTYRYNFLNTLAISFNFRNTRPLKIRYEYIYLTNTRFVYTLKVRNDS
jgi:hypothetical protein